jgi:hypothetical protein
MLSPVPCPSSFRTPVPAGNVLANDPRGQGSREDPSATTRCPRPVPPARAAASTAAGSAASGCLSSRHASWRSAASVRTVTASDPRQAMQAGGPAIGPPGASSGQRRKDRQGSRKKKEGIGISLLSLSLVPAVPALSPPCPRSLGTPSDRQEPNSHAGSRPIYPGCPRCPRRFRASQPVFVFGRSVARRSRGAAAAWPACGMPDPGPLAACPGTCRRLTSAKAVPHHRHPRHGLWLRPQGSRRCDAEAQGPAWPGHQRTGRVAPAQPDPPTCSPAGLCGCAGWNTLPHPLRERGSPAPPPAARARRCVRRRSR